MIDLKRTVELVRGSLFEPEPTWAKYLPEAGDWKKTAALLTVPLIVAVALIAYLFGFLHSDSSIFGMFRPTILSTFMRILLGLISAAVIAVIVSALSGLFHGKKDFALGLAATTLAFVPGYIGQAMFGFPKVGWLIALGLSVYSLILLWKIIPSYLEVPQASRVGHYILSLVLIIVASVIMAKVFGSAGTGMGGGPAIGSSSDVGSPGAMSGGVLGGLARQGELMAAAEEDRYDPPTDRELSEKQVKAFMRTMSRSAEMSAEKEKRMRDLAERADNDDEEISFKDIGEMIGGVGGMVGLQTIEIEVVKSAGGNWAEHQWVRETLRAAWIQKDLNDAVSHNYALYKKYESELEPYIAQ